MSRSIARQRRAFIKKARARVGRLAPEIPERIYSLGGLHVGVECHNAETSAPSGRRGFVYVLCNERGVGPFKVGFTKSPVARVKELQTGCPFRLGMLLIIEADAVVERVIHRKLSEYRLTGEWFRDAAEVRECFHGIRAVYEMARLSVFPTDTRHA